MAKKTAKKSGKKSVGGPFLAAAVFCESIMQDKDGVASAIRILDTMQILISPQAPPDVPSKDQPLQLVQHILIIIRTGDEPGKHRLKLVINPPSGTASEIMDQEVVLSKEAHGGTTVKSALNMRVFSSGVFW